MAIDTASDAPDQGAPDLGGGEGLGRVAAAAFVGTAIEFYDFFLYGMAAALVFGREFFPVLTPVNALLAAFSVYAVAFVARPIGAVVFGHFGDRLGRKAVLVASLLMMGLSTAAVGVLPGYGRLGGWAPAILVLLRFCQGFGLGGEWGGAALLLAEYAPVRRRGRYAGYLQLGPCAGSLLATTVFLLLSAGLSESEFVEWGWRLPFLASLLLVGVGLFVRLRIAETPVFAEVAAAAMARSGAGGAGGSGGPEGGGEAGGPAPSDEAGAGGPVRHAVPVLAVLREHWHTVLLGGGSLSFGYALFYLSNTYALAYATGQLGLDRTLMLTLQLLAAPAGALAVWFSAGGSDRWGRRRTVLVATGVAACWSLLVFPLLESLRPALVLLSLVGSSLLLGLLLGPVGAYLPELFPTRVRYTGAALTYNLGGVVGGGTAPLLATKLTARYGTATPVGWYLAGLGLASVLCLLALPETGGVDLTADQIPGARRGQQAPSAVSGGPAV
ncbi:MFS transporter [Kitasatospora sp. NBC_01287]|uniref:MFS transporter n=1 Tax=Kitasatospora sp. NBC_01287 TaxID=2903573 RepID=UPI00224FA270|nr:MFS transporter [Kitasatospora sp. NBC_01287]MCX4747125.1 MFS transporter [Kitasatospora sp. NBC_01287]